MVGGTASALGGGKFANGAYTAAFQHLLNAEAGPAIRKGMLYLHNPNDANAARDMNLEKIKAMGYFPVAAYGNGSVVGDLVGTLDQRTYTPSQLAEII